MGGPWRRRRDSAVTGRICRETAAELDSGMCSFEEIQGTREFREGRQGENAEQEKRK